MRAVVGISGASGAIFGVSLLGALRELGVETHLVVTRMGRYVVRHECGIEFDELKSMASFCHDNADFAAPVASGSFRVDVTAVVPCSMKTLAGVAHGYSDSLVCRACDVAVKERRKLILVPRETPLSSIHLENMLALSRAGATIFPPVPGFYGHPETLEDVVLNITGRLLDLMGLDNDLITRWK